GQRLRSTSRTVSHFVSIISSDLLFSRSSLMMRCRSSTSLAPSGGESPHPNTQYSSDDKRDHAYPHRYLVSCDRYLRLFDQAHHVANGKKGEDDTRDTQSSSL